MAVSCEIESGWRIKRPDTDAGFWLLLSKRIGEPAPSGLAPVRSSRRSSRKREPTGRPGSSDSSVTSKLRSAGAKIEALVLAATLPRVLKSPSFRSGSRLIRCSPCNRSENAF